MWSTASELGLSYKFYDPFPASPICCLLISIFYAFAENSRPRALIFLYGAVFLLLQTCLIRFWCIYFFIFRVALATKENLQSQRGVLHGVTNRLSAVTSILLSIQLKIVVSNAKTRLELKVKISLSIGSAITYLQFSVAIIFKMVARQLNVSSYC